MGGEDKGEVMIISRQVNLLGTDEKGNTHTLVREFVGVYAILQSYFMLMQSIVDKVSSDKPKVIYITSKCSYFALKNEQ